MRLHGDRPDPDQPKWRYPITDYKAGAVVTLTMENFMSTDNTKYQFNPTTNYIFGANGTGKSTIVAGLFLIFDGRASKLGRSDDLSMYVNRERPNKKARITVEISTGKGTTIGIERSWCSGKNKNTRWKMRAERSSTFHPLNNKDELTRTLNRYNLHVMNLMQFLPQEKVNDLSDLSSKDRLEAFQQSIRVDGDENLLEKHQKLIEYQTTMKDAKNQIQIAENALVDLKRTQERDQVRVERFNDMKAALEKKQKLVLVKNTAEWCLKKELLEFVEACYDSWEEQHKEVKEKLLKECSFNLEKLDKEEATLKKRVFKEPGVLDDKKSQEYKLLTKAVAASTSLTSNIYRVNKYKQETIDVLKENQELEISSKNKEDAYPRIKEAAEENKAEMQRQKQEINRRIEGLVKQLERETPVEDNLRKKQEEAQNAITTFQNELNHIETQLKAQESFDAKRVLALQRTEYFKRAQVDLMNTIKLWELIDQNRDRFSAEVFPPPILSLGCTPAHLDILMDSVHTTPLMSIICQNSEDMRETNTIARENGLHRIANARVEQGSLDRMQTDRLDFKRYGFECSLLDFLHGPEPVRRYLCQNSNVHNIVYGQKEPNLANMSERDQKKLRTYYVYNKKARVFKKVVRRQNQYTGNFNTVDTNPASRASMGECFTYFKDLGKEAELTRQRADIAKRMEVDERRLHEIKKERQQYAVKITALQKEINDLKTELKGGNSKEHKVRGALKEYNSILRKRKNTPFVLLELQKFIKKEVEQSIVNLKAIGKCIEALNRKFNLEKDHVKKYIEVCGKKAFFLNEKEKRESQLKDQIEQGALFKKDRDAVRQLLVRAESRLIAQGDKVLNKTRVEEIVKRVKKMDQWKEDYVKMPEITGIKQYNDKEEQLIEKIGLEIRQAQSKYDELRSMGTPIDESDVQKYHTLVRNIEKETRRIEKMKKQDANQANVTEELKNAWLPELEAQVAFVAERFKKNFATINCKADVELYIPDNPNDFAEYGLDIKVQYRAGDEMAIIKVNRQSGGERSVAAMLFLLSMPTKNCPFRLVDEINQGMDSYNEQNVYKVVKELTDTAKEKEMCQLFIISPKLLRNIQYAQKGSVSLLHNSFPRCPSTFISPMSELAQIKKIES